MARAQLEDEIGKIYDHTDAKLYGPYVDSHTIERVADEWQFTAHLLHGEEHPKVPKYLEALVGDRKVGVRFETWRSEEHQYDDPVSGAAIEFGVPDSNHQSMLPRLLDEVFLTPEQLYETVTAARVEDADRLADGVFLSGLTSPQDQKAIRAADVIAASTMEELQEAMAPSQDTDPLESPLELEVMWANPDLGALVEGIPAKYRFDHVQYFVTDKPYPVEITASEEEDAPRYGAPIHWSEWMMENNDVVTEELGYEKLDLLEEIERIDFEKLFHGDTRFPEEDWPPEEPPQ